jgi:CHASE2 domain-containing sensor protein
VKHFENDTTAAIATAISGSSAVIHFAQTWQPVVSLCVGVVGIISGIFAIRYYSKKINSINGKN